MGYGSCGINLSNTVVKHLIINFQVGENELSIFAFNYKNCKAASFFHHHVFHFSSLLLQQVPNLFLPAALLRVAVLEAGWSYPVELLGCVYANMAVEAVGHHRGVRGHRSLGPQPSVQVRLSHLYVNW